MVSSLRERLLIAEDDFLTAISRDPQSLETCHTTWEALLEDLRQALSSHSLDDGTIELAHATSSRIAILTEAFLDFYAQSNEITSQLENEFAQLSLSITPRHGNLTHAEPPFVTAPSSDQVSHDIGAVSTIPPYIASAYRWLLKNLNDPYPPNSTKQYIADYAGTDVRHVNSWFVNVRRRIGWTAISRKYFAGSRTETIDAAHRVLVAEDSDRPLDPDVRLAFEQMKVTAEELYFEKFGKSILPSEREVVVRNLVDNCSGHQQASNSDDRGRTQFKHTTGTRDVVSEATFVEHPGLSSHSLLTPPPALPLNSHLPSDASDDTESEILSSKRVVGHKRRISSCSSDSGDSFDDFHLCANKRFRPISALPDAAVDACQMSPVHTMPNHCHVQLVDVLHSPSVAPQSTSISRKRRRSDADTTPLPKRPRDFSHGSRLQAVPDPSHIETPTSQFEHWFKDHFELPEHVATDELDVSTPVDVDLFSGWTVLCGVKIDPPAPLSTVHFQTYPPDTVFPSVMLSASSTRQAFSPENFSNDSTPQTMSPISDNWQANSEYSVLTDTTICRYDDLPCPPLSASGSSSPASPLETDLSDIFNMDDLLSLPEWSLISASDYPRDGQPSSLLSFLGLDSVVPVDAYPTQYDTALPFNHNPSYPPVSGFFDDIISQEIPNSDCDAFVPLVPSIAQSLNHSCYPNHDMLDRRSKLEELLKLQAEARKLEAELAL